VFAPATGFTGKAGSEVKPEVRISARLCSSWLPQERVSKFMLAVAADFSVNEKDEARPVRECALAFVECLHSPICGRVKVFFIPRAGLSTVNRLRQQTGP